VAAAPRCGGTGGRGYAGIFLILAGFGLAFGSWVSAVAALLIVSVGMLPRIRVEERALAQAFGADYTDYAKSTARVLPHVW
jgi:protein-S-isoprenylcysteine O-methyltransferase Ste14